MVFSSDRAAQPPAATDPGDHFVDGVFALRHCRSGVESQGHTAPPPRLTKATLILLLVWLHYERIYIYTWGEQA